MALLSDRDRATAADLFAMIRGYFPDATEEECRDLLWECTSYPLGPDVAHYRRALARLKATLDAGETPCELCNRPAAVVLPRLAWCWGCHNRMCVRPA